MRADPDRWAAQVGPALAEADAASLLGVSIEDLTSDNGCLRVIDRDGKVRYPTVQFQGRVQVPGLSEVVPILRQATNDEGALAWLTGHHEQLGCKPIEALRDSRLGEVLTAARRYARHAR